MVNRLAKGIVAILFQYSWEASQKNSICQCHINPEGKTNIATIAPPVIFLMANYQSQFPLITQFLHLIRNVA